MNPYLAIVLAAIIGRYALSLATHILNLRHFSPELPDEFRGHYDLDRYARSQQYLEANTRFDIISDTAGTLAVLLVILLGGFDLADRAARAAGWADIPTGLLFAAIVALAGHLFNLPLAVYHTFVIEERFGFNRTTARTFVLDELKSLALGLAIGAPVFAAILWFFETVGPSAWLYCWVGVCAFQLLVIFIAPYVIMPLFNKFTPLAAGELRERIEDYARRQNFAMKGVFTMDGSRRSAKTNAFFTGFGRSKRIVLFDTLIAKHPPGELLAVVAHEMGHYRHRHIPKAIVRAFVSSGIMFFLLSRVLGNPGLFAAFRMDHVSTYASLVLFGFLYAPIALVMSFATNAISRRHENEADDYAAETTGDVDAMVAALRRIAVENLANLTPHPLDVWLNYSHPPVLTRIRRLNRHRGPVMRDA